LKGEVDTRPDGQGNEHVENELPAIAIWTTGAVMNYLPPSSESDESGDHQRYDQSPVHE